MATNSLMSQIALRFNALRFKITMFKNPKQEQEQEQDLNVSANKVMNNQDLLYEILLRLPAKNLPKFKLVSKNWLFLISNPRFCLDWQRNFESNGLFFYKLYSHPKYVFVPLNPSNNETKIVSSSSSRPYNDRYYDMRILQSCNGLLLCCSCFRFFVSSDDEYYVCNPATDQIRTLPQLPSEGDKNFMTTDLCLAFDPSSSPDYKVICISPRSYRDCRLSIYSSQTKIWTQYQQPFVVPPVGDVLSYPTFWNGTALWLDLWHKNIFAFDVKHQLFAKLDSPRTLKDSFQRFEMTKFDCPGQNAGVADLEYFGESRGRLYYILQSEDVESRVDVYEMDREEWKWSVKYSFNVNSIVRDLCCKVPHRQWIRLNMLFLDVGAEPCLVMYCRGEIVSYNLKRNETIKCGEMDISPDEEVAFFLAPWAYCIHYSESIHSV